MAPQGAPLLVFANVHPGEIRAIEDMIAAWTARGVDAAGRPHADTDRADVQIMSRPDIRRSWPVRDRPWVAKGRVGLLDRIRDAGHALRAGRHGGDRGRFDPRSRSHNPMEALGRAVSPFAGRTPESRRR